MSSFGAFVRGKRESLARRSSDYSVRRVAARVGFEPSYLSKVERDEVAPPSEAKIVLLARELGEDPDILLAMAGKVSTDLREAITKRPKLFADLIRQVKNAPNRAILKIVREVRDGKW